MQKRILHRWIMILFISFVYLAGPFIKGYDSNLKVKSIKYEGAITAQRKFKVSLSGSTAQSLSWDIDTAMNLTVRVRVNDIWSVPTGVGPFSVSAGTPEIQPLFLPVCEEIEISFSGSGTGKVAIAES